MLGLTPDSPPELAEMEAYAIQKGFPVVGPVVGRLLWLLTSSRGARSVFEMGSGFGYSTGWFAMAVGDSGRVVWTDGSTANYERAREHLGKMGLSHRVEYHVGDALEILSRIGGSYDVIFIDVDKHLYPRAFDVALPHLAAGGLLITDNVLWGGSVAREEERGEIVQAIREYNRKIYAHPDLLSVILPLRDGVAVSHKMR